jgi:hypothetical protein
MTELDTRISVKANARKRVMPKLKFEPMKPALPVTRIMIIIASNEARLFKE